MQYPICCSTIELPWILHVGARTPYSLTEGYHLNLANQQLARLKLYQDIAGPNEL